MDGRTLARIESDPNYLRLVKERKSFGWTLTIIMLILYYGYIALVAFDPTVIAAKLSGSITIGQSSMPGCPSGITDRHRSASAGSGQTTIRSCYGRASTIRGRTGPSHSR